MFPNEIQLAQICNALTWHIFGIDLWKIAPGPLPRRLLEVTPPPSFDAIDDDMNTLLRQGRKSDAALLRFAWELSHWPTDPDATVDVRPLLNDANGLARIAGLFAALSANGSTLSNINGWILRNHHNVSPSYPTNLERLTESDRVLMTCGDCGIADAYATCVGAYTEARNPEEIPRCDACCAHTCSDGYCWELKQAEYVRKLARKTTP